MSLTVLALDAASLRTSREFRGIAAVVYRGDPTWSPQSEQAIDALCAEAADGRVRMHPVVARSGARAVARAVAILDPAASHHGGPEGWIGLFECVRDHRDAGAATIRACHDWLVRAGCDSVSAPRVDALTIGLLTAGFSEPQTVFTPHNPEYYADILLACGFAPETTMQAYRFTAAHAPRLRVPVVGGVRVRATRKDAWDRDLKRIHTFQEQVFADRTTRLPRPEEGTLAIARRLAPVIDPDLCLIAEDRDGDTVGVLLCLPDHWQRRPRGVSPDRARLLSIGIHPGWRGNGAALTMASALEARLLEKGYRTLEASWIRSDNAPPHMLVRRLGGELSRELTLYRAHAGNESASPG